MELGDASGDEEPIDNGGDTDDIDEDNLRLLVNSSQWLVAVSLFPSCIFEDQRFITWSLV